MTAPDWKLLLVSVNDRTAIFSEDFPAKIAGGGDEVQRRFSHDEAHEVLYTVAGAWPTLGRNHADANTRYLYRSSGGLVCRFRAVELRPGALVVDDVTRLRYDLS